MTIAFSDLKATPLIAQDSRARGVLEFVFSDSRIFAHA
jgi:hypothetical protein